MTVPRQRKALSSRPATGPKHGRPRRAGLPNFQRTDADTVMFASARAISSPSQMTGPRHRAGGAPGAPGFNPRRTWLSRAVLALIMVTQAALTLRMHNTAFEDEALYLYVGHLEIAHWLHGAALQGDYPSYFSGAPVLYPVLGALFDSIGGLTAARALSLAEMLAATGLLYTMSRRLFNERVALCAAITFAVAEPTLFLGNLATYDATALCLLAVAAWLVVRTAAFRWPAYLLAAPVAVLAVAAKYASLLFVPSIVVLAGLAAVQKPGRKALIAPVALGVTTAGLLAGVLYLAGPDYLTGIKFTTLNRFQGNSSVSSLLWDCVQWIGVPFALAVIGAVAYAWRPFTEPGEEVAPGGGRAAPGAARRGHGRQPAARTGRADPDPHVRVAAEARRLRAVAGCTDHRGRPRPGRRRPLPPRPGRHRRLGRGAGARHDAGQQPVQRLA